MDSSLQQPFLIASKSSNLIEALEILITTARTVEGRSYLASLSILPATLHLIQSRPLNNDNLLLLSLKLLRNLCAGDATNQQSFIDRNGVAVLSEIITSEADVDPGITRTGLQVLGNASLGGDKHKRAVWEGFFPDGFLAASRARRRETCDPLCMVLYTCVDGVPGLGDELCGDRGVPILVQILRTVSLVGFGEDWLKLLLSRICLEETHFPRMFSSLYSCSCDSDDEECNEPIRVQFSTEQAYLLSVVSEILNERIMERAVSEDFALCTFAIFRRSVGFIESVSRGIPSLPTGSSAIDVLGYSLTILRDISAQDSKVNFKDEDSVDVVDKLLVNGLVELLLSLLGDLEPPLIIRKVMRQAENQEASYSNCPKVCPYKGFRRDIVAVIGNCAYQRKHVQDEIREKNGILLLLQQCVSDEENPYLREWGIWAVRNLLEGNAENQLVVAELELQKSLDVPELAGLDLKVEVDKLTRRAKLVNISASGS